MVSLQTPDPMVRSSTLPQVFVTWNTEKLSIYEELRTTFPKHGEYKRLHDEMMAKAKRMVDDHNSTV